MAGRELSGAKRIVPRDINGAPAYFRVYFVFGSVWVAWWNCYKDNYRVVTPQEGSEFNLKPLEEIIRRIATFTGMNFFSSEIAQTESGEFVAIDYMNDQCHMLSQSANPLSACRMRSWRESRGNWWRPRAN